jgi:hypothetical protein
MVTQGSQVLKLFQKLALFIPILFLIGLFNYAVDPAYLFKPKVYEKGLADMLLNKRTVTNVTNYNERIMQKFYIMGLNEKKDLVVMGSSRSFLIGNKIFPNKNMFNSAVSGAVLEDDMAIYQMYRKKNLLPKAILLNLDPWMLNRNNSELRWQFLAPEYSELAKVIGVDAGPVSDVQFRQYLELVSPSYLQSAIRVFKRTGGRLFEGDPDQADDRLVKYPDGTLRYHDVAKTRSVEVVRAMAQAYEEFNRPYHLRYFDKLDIKAMEDLEKFIKLIKADGVELVIFLPAYHPIAYDILMKDQFNRNIMKAQEFYKDLAQRYDIEVVGSYNPSDDGLVETDFYDAMHLRPEGVQKVLNGIKTLK